MQKGKKRRLRVVDQSKEICKGPEDRRELWRVFLYKRNNRIFSVSERDRTYSTRKHFLGIVEAKKKFCLWDNIYALPSYIYSSVGSLCRTVFIYPSHTISRVKVFQHFSLLKTILDLFIYFMGTTICLHVWMGTTVH